MVRLSRNRQEDPVWENDDVKSHQRYAKRDEPNLKQDTTGARFADHGDQDGDADDVSFGVSVEDLADLLPTFDQRRRILATDALASVEGFRVIVQLTMQYLFGVNFCTLCPDCATRGNPCQDLCGSSAKPEGGILVV